MEIDPKLFFVVPPRIREDVRIYINAIGTKIIERVLEYSRMLHIETIDAHCAILLTTLLCNDPITTYQSENGLCIQTCKIKSMQVLLGTAIRETEAACKETRYGNIDKKIVCQTSSRMKIHNQNYTRVGVCCIAACMAEILGILLNSSVASDKCTTLTMEMVEKFGKTHKNSTTGIILPNGSLIRLLEGLNLPN